ncbi:MAG: L-aspartate oxidase [Phycisphaerales bacterium]
MHPLFDQRRYLIPFRSSLLPQIFTDTLVIGAGVAGLRAGIAAAAHGEVIVLAKGELAESNTAWAQGGVAVPADPIDAQAHIKDTLACGCGLADEPVVRAIVERGPDRVRELIAWGIALDRDAQGRLSPTREGGHSASRILHALGDATGRELQRCLEERLRSLPTIRLFERCFTLDLITPTAEPGSPVVGAITHHPRFGLQMIWAESTILATGGAGQLYRETTNPKIATGDGPAMAYRAGATVADMAFIQFHPTTLYLPGAPRSLISEAVRGEGALLVDASGRRFMQGVHPQAELAPRDVVSRAIVRQIAKQGGQNVWLDCRPVPAFASRFPGIAAELKRFDLDPQKDPVPVHPAAHYTIGGVRTDLSARTDVPGLFAVGEAASTGLHGANRLASNSLLEGLVMGEIAGHAAGESRAGRAPGAGRRGPIAIVSDIRPSDHGELDLADVRSSLRSAMWRNVGIERTGPKLADAIEMFDFWARYTLDKIFDDPAGWETQNMLLAGGLVARSAAWREESRGAHSRDDFPAPRPQLAAHDLWRRGREAARTEPAAAAPRSAPAVETIA